MMTDKANHASNGASGEIPRSTPNTSQLSTVRPTFRVGLSQAFHNKDLLKHKRFYAQGFTATDATIDQLAQHVTSGRAFAVGVYQGDYRAKTRLVSAQIIGLDFDEFVSTAQLADHPFAQYAAFCYATPTSTPEKPKSRLVFVLSEPIEGENAVSRYETLERAIRAEFADLKPDSTGDAARFFYGSATADYWLQADRVLPLTITGALTAAEAHADYAQWQQKQIDQDTPKGRIVSGQRAERYALAAMDHIIDEIAALKADRHARTRALIYAVFCKVGWPGITDDLVTRGVIRAATANGYVQKHGMPALERLIEGARSKATMDAFDLPDESPVQRRGKKIKQTIAAVSSNQPSEADPVDICLPSCGDMPTIAPLPPLPPFTADQRVNVRYITELDANDYIHHRALLIKSPTNTGKTSFIGSFYQVLKALLGREPRVLVLTHRQALAENLSRRLTDETGASFETYKGLTAAQQRQVNRLVTCYNSAWKLAPKQGDSLPKYDLFIVDELQQFHAHLEGDTMRGGEALRAYTYLKQLVAATPRFIGLDAHMSDVSRGWVEAIAGSVYCIENTHVFDRGALTLHSDASTVIHTAQQMAMNADLPIVMTCTSAAQAKALYELFAPIYPDRVRLVHGENSEDRDTQAFISAINPALSALKVLIYTTSLGTGVDITTPVAGVFGLFHRVNGLSAYDQHQLLARCRNAAVRHVFVEDCTGRRETDPDRLYKRHERNAFKTGQVCDFDQDGIVVLPPVLRSAGKLLAMLGAEKNAAFNAPLRYFVALATGYTITHQDGQNNTVKVEMKAAREMVAVREKEAILAADPVDHKQLQAARDNGELTPEKRYGNEAYKILDAVGRDQLTDELYDDLHTSEKRRKLRRFTNLGESPDTLKDLDRGEAKAGVLFSKRGYHTVNAQLANDAFTAVWGENWRTGTDQELTAEDIESRLADFLEGSARHDLYSFMGRRYGSSQKAAPLLRWMLEQHGLALRSRQIMRDGKRFRVYQLDGDSLSKMEDYACTRRLHLVRKRAEAETKAHGGITQNPYIETLVSDNPTESDAQWRISRTANLAALGVL